MITARVTGGNRIKRHLRRRKRAVEAVNGTKLSIGFHDPWTARVAIQNEYGTDHVPERPAMRQSVPATNEVVHKRAKLGIPTPAALKGIAGEAASEMRRGFIGFRGAPPAESTIERKRGTEGEGRQLVGPHGPRLIEHIEGKVE